MRRKAQGGLWKVEQRRDKAGDELKDKTTGGRKKKPELNRVVARAHWHWHWHSHWYWYWYWCW